MKQPTFNRLIVEVVDEPAAGRIIAPPNGGIHAKGKILAVGPLAGIRNDIRYHTFVIGQKVIFQKSQAVQINVGSDTFLLLTDDSALTVEE